MNLRDQRTGSVDYSQLPQLALLPDFGRNPVSAVNDALTLRNLRNAVHENGALLLELLNHKAVMDDLLTDVDRRPESFERDPDNIDGTHHSGAEPTRLQQQ